MDNYSNQAGISSSALASLGHQSSESTRVRIERAKRQHQEQIDRIDECLALLDSHPELERLQDLLRQTHY